MDKVGETGMTAAEVRAWLHKHLCEGKEGQQDGQLPEIGEATLEALAPLAKLNIQADKRAEWQAREARSRSESYDAQEELLASVRLGVRDMPGDVSSALDALSQCAVLLGCSDASSATLLCALSDLEDETAALQHDKLRNTAKLLDLRRKREDCERKLGDLSSREGDLQAQFEAGREDDVGRGRRVEYITAKARQYEAALMLIKEELRECGVTDSIYHSTLVEQGDSVQAAHAEIRQLQARVGHFQGLPGDLRLAKERVHEAMLELDGVEKELQDRIQHLVVG